MATFEARGYANKVETKEGSKGPFTKFTLAVKQKVKAPGGEVRDEKLYVNCIDFGDHGEPPADGEYIGVKGFITITAWSRNGKNGINADLVVQGYEKVAQLPKREGAAPKPTEPPADPFDLG